MFNRYSPVLSRDPTLASTYRKVGSLYNELNAFDARSFT
jgi:hypothetical protein